MPSCQEDPRVFLAYMFLKLKLKKKLGLYPKVVHVVHRVFSWPVLRVQSGSGWVVCSAVLGHLCWESRLGFASSAAEGM